MSGIQEWVVNGYSERWLHGFPWVYAKEIVRRRSAGREVRIRSERGEVLARGWMDDGPVAARCMSRRRSARHRLGRGDG